MNFRYAIVNLSEFKSTKKHFYSELEQRFVQSRFNSQRPVIAINKANNTVIDMIYGKDFRGQLTKHMLWGENVNLAIPLKIEDKKVSFEEKLYRQYKYQFETQRTEEGNAFEDHVNKVFQAESQGVESNNQFVEDFKTFLDTNSEEERMKPSMKVNSIVLQSGETANYLQIRLFEGVVLYAFENQMLYKTINSDVIIVHDYHHDIDVEKFLDFLSPALTVERENLKEFFLGS
ncbi:hypothetical protein ACQUY5_29235 [Bacillus cereus]|uniref:hypothetical protein n=1 Tax=Bacillus cereus TaxID=1396 RepID=UPI003D17A7E0